MKGEISEEFLRQKWWDEELNVDIELKGYNYLCKMAHFFAPNNTTHKRGIVSSQRIEMLNKVIKKNGNNAYDMLKQFFHISMKWFEKSASILYPKNQLLTNYAEDVLHQIIQKEFLEKEFDELLHFKKNNCECSCFFGHDFGIPCPFTIRLLRINEYSSSINAEKENDLLKSSLIKNENLLKLISSEWFVSTHTKAFTPLISHDKPQNKLIHVNHVDDINYKNLDILAAKIRWLYANSQKYKEKVDHLLEEAQEEIIFPFFNVQKPKQKKTKRFHSSLEINQNHKENDEIMNALSRHLNRKKITKANLLALAEHIMETNKFIPRIGKSSSKDKICNWYKSNWKTISSSLGTVNCLSPDGLEVSETEDDLFFFR